jgi:hypothetical protein
MGRLEAGRDGESLGLGLRCDSCEMKRGLVEF